MTPASSIAPSLVKSISTVVGVPATRSISPDNSIEPKPKKASPRSMSGAVASIRVSPFTDSDARPDSVRVKTWGPSISGTIVATIRALQRSASMPSTGEPKASSDVRPSWATASASPSNPQPLRYSTVAAPSSNGRAIGGTVRSMSAPSEKRTSSSGKRASSASSGEVS